MKPSQIHTFFCVAILLTFCLCFPQRGTGQSASMVLEVKDPTGAPVANAQVQIQPSPSNAEKRQTTHSEGSVSFEVSPGISYDVMVTSPGFLSVTKRVEANSATHQTVEIVLSIKSCPPGPCVMVTDIFPVSFPEQSQAVSPDGRYAVVGVNSNIEPYHTVFLEDRNVKARRKLFTYDRHIVVLWNADSKLFAVTNYVGSDNSRCTIISIDEKAQPIEVLGVLSHQLAEASWKRLQNQLSNHHAYVEAVVWDGPMSLQVKVSGYGDADRKGFAEFYEVLLPSHTAPTPD